MPVKKKRNYTARNKYPLNLNLGIGNKNSRQFRQDVKTFTDSMSFIVTLAVIISAITISIFCIFSGLLARNDVAGNLLGNFGDIATSILLVGSSLVAVLAYKL